ncbi:MAG: response regulator [Candidatus Scalindua sp.]|nr:response regulator [Candidatus Scalindua sp.]
MKFTKSKTLRFQIILVSVLLLFVLIILLGISIKRSLDAKKQTEEYVIINRISGLLNTVAGWQAIERGYGATIIGSNKGDSSPFFPKFLEMSEKGDSRVLQIEKEVETLLNIRSDKTFEKIFRKWRKRYELLVSARHKIASNNISNDEWLDIATLNIRDEFNLRNTTFAPHNTEEKILYLNNVLRPNIAILCEYAGLERALISNTIESGDPLSDKCINRIKRYRSIIDQSLDQILFLKELPSTSTQMKQSIEIFENEFLQSYQLLKEEVYSSSEIMREEIKRVKENIANRTAIFQNYIHGIKTDLLNISKNKDVIALAKSLSLSAEEDIRLPEQLSAVENLFNKYSQVKRVYKQIRFLDNIGYERVHVDFDGNVTNIIHGAKLQDKSERYYFRKSVNLSQGDIYTSPLDLNIEHGRIELPYQPVMRYITPVFVDGKKTGFIIFNLLTNTPSFLPKITGNEGGNDYILANQNGFYLHHTDKVKEWGMMELLNKSHHNIREDYPEVAELILSGSKGHVRLASGSVIVYRPFFPNLETDPNIFWIIIKQIKGVDYPVNASAWFDEATKAINTGLAIASIAGEEATGIMSEMESTTERNVLISYIILGFAVFVFIYFFRWSRNRVLKPIQKLTGATQKIAEGDFSYRVDVKQGDEIGILANNFNIMADELMNDITMRKQAEGRLSAQYYVTKVLAESATIKEALPKILKAICTALQWDLGEIWVLNQQDCVLRCSEIWHIPSVEVSEFKKVTRQTSFAEGIGLPGRILKSAQPAWIADVVQDLNFPRASVAARDGLHGAFGFPILSGNEVLGTISFYSREIRQPDKDLLNMLLSIGSQVGLFMKRKQAENEIKKMAKFPSENPNPVIRIFKNGKILYNNQASMTLLDFWDCQTTKTVPVGILKIVSETIHSGLSGIIEIEFNHFIFSLTFAPVIEEGYVNVYGLNITERKKMETALLQSEKLKAMGMITAGISHDFNNILSIISGNVQLFEMDYKDNKELMNGFRTILKASDDGAEIVRRMSLFTKNKECTAAFLPVDIKGVLEQSIEFVKPRWMNIAKARGIDYDMDFDDLVEVPIIKGNEPELREVFINIINNAMDVMDKGGCLSFRTWQNEGNIFISISDTGEGMPEEVKKNVFVPFYTTKREKGSGLGMSMSYGIIEKHGGKIEVKSKVGKGTTFTIRLPITVSPAQKTELPVEDQKIKAEGLNILAVDDKEDIRSLLEMFFANNGHTVKTVEGGNMAIEVLKTEIFDIVLCDLVMPDISGYEVIAVLNKLEKRPIIGVLTGWSEKIETEDINKLNVDFVIRKPFKFSVLTKSINEALGTDSR